MPITYNYEGPLASPAVDSAYRAGQRTSAQQRRSELERLQLARQQMQQNAALQQQRFQQQAMLQQQGQYGDLQRLLLTDQMRQQSQQGQYAQQMAMEEYRNDQQAIRDQKYWGAKEDYLDYQMNSAGKQESAKIDRQIAQIQSSDYPDTWKRQALGQLEAQRMGVSANPEFFQNEELQPGKFFTRGGKEWLMKPDMSAQEIGIDPSSTSMGLSVARPFGDDDPRSVLIQSTESGQKVISPDDIITPRTSSDPTRFQTPFDEIEDPEVRIKTQIDHATKIIGDRVKMKGLTEQRPTGAVNQTTMAPEMVEVPVYTDAEIEAELQRAYGNLYAPPNQDGNDLLRESAQSVGNRLMQSFDNIVYGDMPRIPDGLEPPQILEWIKTLPPGTRFIDHHGRPRQLPGGAPTQQSQTPVDASLVGGGIAAG